MMREVPGTQMQKKDVVDEWDYEDRKIKVHDGAAFESMRKAGRVAAETLDFITPHVVPGATTDELDRLCHSFIVGQGAIPAPLNYRGFPRSICTSINHVVCHGIPSFSIELHDRGRAMPIPTPSSPAGTTRSADCSGIMLDVCGRCKRARCITLSTHRDVVHWQLAGWRSVALPDRVGRASAGGCASHLETELLHHVCTSRPGRWPVP
jgi:hypothetical protein